jgi:hypothetical protein
MGGGGGNLPKGGSCPREIVLDPALSRYDRHFRQISKSRYDSIDSYLSPCSARGSDIPLEFDEDLCARLKANGIDEVLARHVSHLFIRDPVSLFSEKLNQNDEEDTDHFENIQSTNWQTLRFKPPPPNSPIGWRVEFRYKSFMKCEFSNKVPPPPPPTQSLSPLPVYVN